MIRLDTRQVEVLADRYFSVLMGRLGSLLVFLALGPLIAFMIVLVWADARADVRLELFLCIAAVFTGCMLSCREIVGERSIFKRERMVFLGIPEYVLSKVVILGALDLAQALALVWIVDRWVGLPGNKILLFGVLWLACLAGTMVGLVISGLVSSPDKAVALAPLAILPQILLSKPFLPGGSAAGPVEWARNLMPLTWAHELYQEVVRLPKDPHWGLLLQDLAAALALIVLLFGLACATLWIQED